MCRVVCSDTTGLAECCLKPKEEAEGKSVAPHQPVGRCLGKFGQD